MRLIFSMDISKMGKVGIETPFNDKIVEIIKGLELF